MARKDITDKQVVEAVAAARASDQCLWTVLAEATGECDKVCLRAVERAHERGLLDYGVSLTYCWLTEEGKILLNA